MSRVVAFRRLLTEPQVACALEFLAANSASPIRDELILTLAALAGLRAHEITALSLATLTDGEGHVGDQIPITKQVTKYGTARVLPMPGRVREALIRFRSAFPHAERIADLFEPGATKVVRELLAAIYGEIGYVDGPAPSPGVLRYHFALIEAASKPLEAPKAAEPPARKARPPRIADVVRAVKAVERAGLEVTSTEIGHDGSIKFTHAPAATTANSAYDQWKERRDAGS